MGLSEYEFNVAPEALLGLVDSFGGAQERLRSLEDEIGAAVDRLRSGIGAIGGAANFRRIGERVSVGVGRGISNGSSQDPVRERLFNTGAGPGGLVLGGGFLDFGPGVFHDEQGWAGQAAQPGSEAQHRAALWARATIQAWQNARQRGDPKGEQNAYDLAQRAVYNAIAANGGKLPPELASQVQSVPVQRAIEWWIANHPGSNPTGPQPDPNNDSPSGAISGVDLWTLLERLRTIGGLVAPSENPGSGIGVVGPDILDAVDPGDNDNENASSSSTEMVSWWGFNLIDPPRGL